MNNTEPKNLEAEVSCLGCGMLSSVALDKICDLLTEDMFYDKKNKIIFKAMYEIHKRNDNLDATILKNEIEKDTPINSIGGIEYLSEVIDSVVSSSNIDSYINIIKDKYLRRKLIETCVSIEKNARDEANDQNTVIDIAEKEIFNVTKQRESGEFKTSAEVVKSAKLKLDELSKRGTDITGIATGFIDLDRKTTGLHPGQLIILAARPSMGKTAFALNIAVNAALQSGKNVAVFNLEMTSEELMFRMISSQGAVEGQKLRTGKLNNDDWKKVNEAMSILSDANLYIDDSTSGLTIGEVRAKCRRLAEKGNLGLVVIDYLQLISGGPGYGNNKQQEVSDISRSLKIMSLELGVPVIALSQLSRALESREDKRPMLSDLRESGAIEQDADIVMFLYRDDYYRRKEGEAENPISLVELIIAKHRAGSNGKLYFQFDKSISDFRTSVQHPNEESGE